MVASIILEQNLLYHSSETWKLVLLKNENLTSILVKLAKIEVKFWNRLKEKQTNKQMSLLNLVILKVKLWIKKGK